ncbi:MAG TPA: phospholipase D-like domain-containing protein [Candidatus Thermoplasmatota archaeon]|nr:phospholipase D-like domain-containing protein [Candidatus Thermoplasmatota archaeon]
MIRKKQYVDILIVFCVVSGFVLPLTHQPAKATAIETLLINEVMFHPQENENTNEWIELYNPTSEPFDVAGWMIADEKETDSILADTENGDGTTIIPPGNYAIITDKGTTIYETYTIPDNAIKLSVDDSTLCGYGLNNQQEKIILFDLDNSFIDAVEWGEDFEDVPGSPSTIVSEGNTLARYQEIDTDDSLLDFFECNSPTPGSENIHTIQEEEPTESPDEESKSEENTEDISPSILIIELYYDAHPNINAEYVRLLNPTNKTIDVSGWYLTDKPWKQPDDQPKILFPEETILPSQTSWFITKNATAFFWETAILPDFEYAVDSDPTVAQFLTYRTVSFSNTGGLVGFYTASHRLIDLVIYGDTDEYISGWEGPSIPASGQGVTLKRNSINGTPIDTNSASDWVHHRIYHIGQSDFPVQTMTFNGEITTFVSPDNSYETITRELHNALHSIDMNMYEFSNPFLYEELLDALKRNVTVRLFMEGSPIGGIDDREKYILGNLASQGGLIRFIVSDYGNHVNARYQFDHAKYLLIDNETVIVESCNWVKTGVPKNPSFGNREWGIVVRNKEVASSFSQVFQDDWNLLHSDSYPIEAMNMTYPPWFTLDYEIPTGSYLPQFKAETITGPCTMTPVFSPDTSEQVILDAIDAATATIYVQQLYIYRDWDETISPFVQHLVNKSSEGVLVQVILDYNEQYEGTITIINETKEYLETYGVKVKCISSDWSPFTTIHNKGMIIDNTTVLISSINWNEQSVRKNREAGILIKNQEAASYYTTVFLSDWNLEPYKKRASVFSWADYKYLVLIAVVVCITLVFIVRDWRKRKWT